MPGAGVLDLRIREKRFDDARPVLRDVNFRAGAGEVIALLGQSGAGKTTLLRIALGLDAEFDGSVSLPQGRIGVVFQEPLLLPWLTVTDNLRLVVTDGVPEPDIPALLETVGLQNAASRRPAELSLGMARRASVARALAVDPAVLVLDEPFVSLDRQLASALGALLVARARRRGTLVLVAMHDLGHALAIADRILVLHGQPTSLAEDVAVPGATEARGVERADEDLRRRFAFLDDAEPAEASRGVAPDPTRGVAPGPHQGP